MHQLCINGGISYERQFLKNSFWSEVQNVGDAFIFKETQDITLGHLLEL